MSCLVQEMADCRLWRALLEVNRFEFSGMRCYLLRLRTSEESWVQDWVQHSQARRGGLVNARSLPAGKLDTESEPGYGGCLTRGNPFQSVESVWKVADQQDKCRSLGIWFGAALFPLF